MQATEQKIFAIHLSGKGFISKMYKQLLKTSKKRIDKSIFLMDKKKKLEQISHKREYSNDG